VSRLLAGLVVVLVAAYMLALCSGCGSSHGETAVFSFLGYHGHVYRWVDDVPVRSGVPRGFSRAGGGFWLDGGVNGPFHSDGSKMPVYLISGQPTRIASPNSWGGGYTYYNVYELDPKAKWKR